MCKGQSGCAHSDEALGKEGLGEPGAPGDSRSQLPWAPLSSQGEVYWRVSNDTL